ncbi:MAG: PaaI family thioesterase [Pseudohongiellaceae bacterium]
MKQKFNPADFDILPHYKHWTGDKAEDHIGPFFFYMEGNCSHTAFRVQLHNCNAHDSLHGGILMAFADYTLCLVANGGANESVATVTCNNEFIAPAIAGDLVIGKGELVKRGGSLIFVRAEFKVNDRIILSSSGVIKRLRSS